MVFIVGIIWNIWTKYQDKERSSY